uniref:Adenosine deaminase domain-containing protein n=1 Tax=Esox lucius TaxID=8010 RepID=A0A3P8XJL6_ESOLU
MENEADLFYRQMPKVELHAHLNGSVSFSTIEKLMARKPHLNIEHNMTAILSGQKRTLDECFQVFKVIHQLIDTEEDILMVAKDVIREFAEDGVKYLELRTTPREDKNTGMTKRSYVQTVIEAIRQCKNEGLDIEVRLLVSVDRRHGVEVAMKTVKLAEDFMRSTDGFVVGLDLSGDPTVGHGGDLLPALQKAKNCGLKLSLHLSEVPSQVDESELLLNIPPDRIGHGTFLHPEVGGAQSLVDKVMKNNTPLGKNVLSNQRSTIKVYEYIPPHKHQSDFGPLVFCSIQTDDRGVFCTELSKEYQLAASTFSLSREAMWSLSQKAIDFTFAPDSLKQQLHQKWFELHPSLFQ